MTQVGDENVTGKILRLGKKQNGSLSGRPL